MVPDKMNHKLISLILTVLCTTSCLTSEIGYSDPSIHTDIDNLCVSAEFVPGSTDNARSVLVRSNRSWYAHLNDAESPIPVTDTVEWATIDVQDHFNITGLEDEVLITITFNRNYSEDRIKGVLDFYSEGRKFYSLPIEQDGAVYHLDCTPDKQRANCNNDTIKIAVDCNTAWTAKVADESTANVVIDSESGFDPDTVTVSFSTNKDTNNEKIASIIFCAGSLVKKVNLVQGKSEPFLILAPGNESMIKPGLTEGRLKIQANCEWTARVKDGATLKDVTLLKSSGAGDDATQEIEFSFINRCDDPMILQEATIVVESPVLSTPLEYTFTQRAPLVINFNKLDNNYTVFTPEFPVSYSTKETTHSFKTNSGNTYSVSSIFNYVKTFSSGESELLFRQYDKDSGTYCHFSFPAISKLKLTGVILTFRYEKASYKFKAGIRDASGNKVSPAQNITVQKTGDQLEFILESSEVGVEYMLKAETNSNSYIKQMTLFYE